MSGLGASLYFGPGYVVHISTEHGLEWERAEHRTWRFGLIVALRRVEEREAV